MRDFAKYYDVLFSTKNYLSDLEAIRALLAEFDILNMESLIEVGAGTGNYTLPLAKIAKRVSAIDCDADMVSLGKEKTRHLSHVEWYLDDIQCITGLQPAHVVMMLFYVVNYIKDIKVFFKKIFDFLIKNGVCIFDVWNGDLVLEQGSRVDHRRFFVDHLNVEEKIATSVEIRDKSALLSYDVAIHNEISKECEFQEVIQIKLWTLDEIKQAIKEAKLDLYAVRSRSNPSQDGSFLDSRLWFVVTK